VGAAHGNHEHGRALDRLLPRLSRITGDELMAPDKPTQPADPGRWDLRLYVAGQTDKSLRAISNLNRICQEHLEGRYSIEVIDLLERPQLAAGDQILALPTLVRRLPEPVKKI